MSRKDKVCKYTEADIAKFENVPIMVAASYIGWGNITLYNALQQNRAPFGFAVKNQSGCWSYNISPGLLINYKNGQLPTYRLHEVIDLAAEGFERVLDAKLHAAYTAQKAAKKILDN